ncbi:MAG: universal stress protein [Cocleimonas sp.]|nr:universal stress protein [Cocleimonas sp.]
MDIFKNILVSIDFKAEAESEKIQRAFDMARQDKSITLTFVYIVLEVVADPEVSVLSSEKQEKVLVNDGQQSLEALIASYQDNNPIDNEITCLVKIAAKPSIGVIQQVLRGHHDLLMVSTRDKSIAESMLGSTSLEIMRRCPCPIWAVKPEKNERKKMMVGIHFDNKLEDRNESLNKELLRLTSLFKRATTEELHLVNVVNKSTPEADAKNLSEIEALVTQSNISDLKVSIEILEGDVTKVLSTYARDNSIALVMLGMLSRTGLVGFFIGNTAEKILDDLDCSVVTVKPNSFVSPITLD